MRIPKATNSHSEFVTFNSFSLQQLLHERVTMLSSTHTVCPVNRSVQSSSTQATGQYLDHLSAATFQALSNSTFASRSTMYNMAYVALIFRKIQEENRSLNPQHTVCYKPRKYSVCLPVFTAGLPPRGPPQTQDFMQCLIISGILN